MDLTITAFDRFDLRELSYQVGGNWTTNKGETEGGGGVGGWHNIITKYPSLNRVKNEQNSLRVLPKHVHILNAIYSLKVSPGQKASFKRLLLTDIFHIGLSSVLCI